MDSKIADHDKTNKNLDEEMEIMLKQSSKIKSFIENSDIFRNDSIYGIKNAELNIFGENNLFEIRFCEDSLEYQLLYKFDDCANGNIFNLIRFKCDTDNLMNHEIGVDECERTFEYAKYIENVGKLIIDQIEREYKNEK